MKNPRPKLIVLLLCAALCRQTRPACAASSAAVYRRSVAKIHVTAQRADFSLPWQGSGLMRGTGSAFIIKGHRLLTNAHVVSDAGFLQVQKEGDSRRYDVRVDFIGHDCDLATLTVDDPSFFEGTQPLDFSEDLPELNDEVLVIGYPMGGDRVSVTRGVVSRIDYSVYSHSGVDQHLVLQVDAAINPGNSGGPVLFHGKVVGLAFQGLIWGDNIGYAIPIPVVRHFLEDIADDTYDGYPELGVAFLDARNPAMRTGLRLPRTESGIVVYYVDPFGSGNGVIKPQDVLLKVNGHNIEDDGSVDLDGNQVLFAELLERLQYGDNVNVKLWRDGHAASLRVPLTHPPDPFIFRNQYGIRPRYVMHGGLVFSPLTRDYLHTLGRDLSDPSEQRLLYVMQYTKIDGLYEGREEFVVLIRVLPHPVNSYAGEYVNGIVEEVNGQHISSLRDVVRALDGESREYDVFRFMDSEDSLVLDAAAVRAAQGAIMQAYGVRRPQYLGDSDE